MSDNFNNIESLRVIRDQENIIDAEFEVVTKAEEVSYDVATSDSLMGSIDMVTELYKDIADKYNLDISFDIDSVSSNFKDIVDPAKKHAFRLFLSEGYERITLVMYQKLMMSLPVLVDNITRRQFLESEDIQVGVGLLEKVFDIMEKANELHSKIHVEAADLELRRLAQESTKRDSSSSDDLNKAELQEMVRSIREMNTKKEIE